MRNFTIFRFPKSTPSRYGVIYAALCAALPVVPLLNVKAIVPLTIAASLALLITALRDGQIRRLRYVDSLLWAALAAYLTTTVLASVSSDAWPDGLLSIVKLVGLTVIATILIPLRTTLGDDDIAWVACGLIGGLLVSILWITGNICYESALHYAVSNSAKLTAAYQESIDLYGYFWFKSASALIATGSLVAGIYLHRTGRPLSAIVLVTISAVICHWIGSRTASFGIVAALAAGITYHLLGRYRLQIVLVVMGLSFLLPVWMTVLDFNPNQISARLNPKSSSSNSIVYRMHIWNFVTDKIAEKPLLGWGGGASKRLGTDEIGQLQDATFGKLGEPIPVHPHNAILQVWLEYGLLGALFIYMLMARGLAIADRHVKEAGTRVWAFASGAMIACFFGFNFSIASSWWLATVIIVIAIASAFAGPATVSEPAMDGKDANY